MARLFEDFSDFLLDDDHDIVITDDIQFVNGVDGVAQHVNIRLRMFVGENFTNLDLGVPYFTNEFVDESRALLGQKFNEQKVLSVFRQIILGTPGVLSVISSVVSFDNITRTLSGSWEANTIFGRTEAQAVEVP